MGSNTLGLRAFLTAAVLAASWAGSVQAAGLEATLRDRALALNQITGTDPIKGEILTLTNDPAGTKKLLAEAAKMVKGKDQPLNYNASYILARSAHLVKDYEASQIFYRLCAAEAMKLHSSQKLGTAYEGLISLSFTEQRFGESEKLCREFLELSNGQETSGAMKLLILRQMVQAMAKQGKIDDANRVVDNLLKLQPDNWLTLELRGWVQREAGKYADSAKTYEDVLQRVGKEKRLAKDVKTEYANDLRYILSGVYVDALQINKAAENLKMLLSQEPENPSYNNDLGYIWADHDMNLKESEKLIRKAIELDRKRRQKSNSSAKSDELKDNAAYLDSLGWVLYKQKKYKEALPFLEQAIQDEDGRHIDIYDHLAEVYIALGQKDQAVSTWRKAVKSAKSDKRDQSRKVIIEKKLGDSR